MEEWRQIKDYNHRYMVSSLGRVKSIAKGNSRILRGTIDSDGYLIFTLYTGDGTSTKMKAQRIVAISFIDNPEYKPTVNHKDGNKLNNNVQNLEWATFSEQVNHAIKTGLKTFKKGRALSLDHRRKLSIARMGAIPWNKGKVGVQIPWNKGLKSSKH